MEDQHALVAPLGAGGGQQARLADPARPFDHDHLADGAAGTRECPVQLGQILFAFQQLAHVGAS